MRFLTGSNSRVIIVEFYTIVEFNLMCSYYNSQHRFHVFTFSEICNVVVLK